MYLSRLTYFINLYMDCNICGVSVDIRHAFISGDFSWIASVMTVCIKTPGALLDETREEFCEEMIKYGRTW